MSGDLRIMIICCFIVQVTIDIKGIFKKAIDIRGI